MFDCVEFVVVCLFVAVRNIVVKGFVCVVFAVELVTLEIAVVSIVDIVVLPATVVVPFSVELDVVVPAVGVVVVC